MKKTEVPLYPKTDDRGRPVAYDFSNFRNEKVTCVVLMGVGREQYSSVRTTFARWRKQNGVEGRFTYEFHAEKGDTPRHLVIWRA